MMELNLTNGFKTVIDDDDFDLVRGYRWVTLNSGVGRHHYAIANWTEDGKKQYVLLHRLILGLTDRKVQCDHIDGNGLNNRRSNLRMCSHAENMRNSKTRRHSSTQVRNVMEETIKGCVMLRASVTKDGKRYRKWFSRTRLEDAIAWVEMKRKELHGEFDYARGVGS